MNRRPLRLSVSVLVVFLSYLPIGAASAPKIRLLSGGHYLAYLAIDLAEYSGLFSKYGLDVAVTTVRGGTEQALSLIAGQADFALLGAEHAIKAQLQGKHLALLGLVGRTPTQMLVASPKTRCSQPAALKGCRVAVSGLGSLSHMMLLAILKKEGLAAADVEVLPMRYPAAVAALEQGAIDAAMLVDPLASQVVAAGKGIVLVDLVRAEGVKALFGVDHPSSILVAREEYCQAAPALCSAMLASLMEANAEILSRESKVLFSRFPTEVTGDEKSFVESLEHGRGYFTTDSALTPQMIQLVVESMRSVNAIPADAAVDVQRLLVFAGGSPKSRPPTTESADTPSARLLVITVGLGLLLLIGGGVLVVRRHRGGRHERREF